MWFRYFLQKAVRIVEIAMENTRAHAAAIAGIRTIRTLPPGAGFGTLLRRIIIAALAVFPAVAQASLLPPALENAVADILSWVVLVVVPIVGIAVFWLVHILPEKIAEKKKHPQAKAIHTLCLLSLFFGGMLWPLAWLWAYSKPVMYKLAYGTDVAEPEHEPPPARPQANEPKPMVASEMRLLEQKIAELEAQIAHAEDFRGRPS
jgi:CBS domain containing-hemolysin-like protein